ncbi:hypothetical protein ACWCYZ_31755 [Streptomyces virginiae]
MAEHQIERAERGTFTSIPDRARRPRHIESVTTQVNPTDENRCAPPARHRPPRAAEDRAELDPRLALLPAPGRPRRCPTTTWPAPGTAVTRKPSTTRAASWSRTRPCPNATSYRPGSSATSTGW